MKFYIADAFTEELFGGNPAGIVILPNDRDFPDNEVMRKTAAELRYSETAFIKQLAGNQFNIRYFTPADEVDLCGHATIASFVCLLDAGLVKPACSYINKTIAGDLNIKVDRGFTMMGMASPEHIDTIKSRAALNELYEIMGLKYEAVTVRDSTGEPIELLPMIISTGLPDIMMPVVSATDLASIRPDFPKLTELSQKYGVVGVHAFTLDGCSPEVTARCRNFAPLYDIDEEAATGTSNGALTYYLYKNGVIPDNATSVFIQGESMGRPSKILSQINTESLPATDNNNEKCTIQVGGSAVILATGEINL